MALARDAGRRRGQARGHRHRLLHPYACRSCRLEHTGSNGKWVPTFPNARYLFARREWEYWKSEAGIKSLPRTGDYITDSVLPVIRSGQAELIDEDHASAAACRLELVAGHTPGLMALHVAGDSKEAILPGDLMHHHLQLRYPHWSTRFCADQAMARATRAQFRAQRRHRQARPPDAFPDADRRADRRDGDHYRFVYDGE